ncbi:hypothetical protein [Paracoccus hibiscisoli]|nr:hypothetical protein [Paracoccus hibiscisoli]
MAPSTGARITRFSNAIPASDAAAGAPAISAQRASSATVAVRTASVRASS